MDPYRSEDRPIEHIELGEDDCMWFLAKARGQKSGPRLVATCREMEKQNTTLRANTEKCIAVFQYGGDAKDSAAEDHFPIEETLVAYNAAQNTVETVHSKVCKSKIDPMPLTEGGGYLERRRARDMGKAIVSVLEDNECDVIEEEMMMDALVTDHGAGACLVVDREDSVEIRHIPVEDVWFDEAECRQKHPSCTYYVPKDGLDKFALIELFCKENDEHPGLVGTAESRRRAILAASMRTDAAWRTATPMSKHRVRYYEAWHPPTCREEVDEEYEDADGEKKTRRVAKHDGRHVIAVEGEDGTLFDEPWEEDHAPLLLIVPRRRRRSVWGLSLMRSLLAPQREYEKVTKKIQHQHQKMGSSGYYAQRNSNVNVRDIEAGTFGAGWVMEGDGPSPPVPLVTEPVAQGTYMYADSIPRNMMERNGVSTLSASSQLPAGLQDASGKALQVFEDFEAERLMPYHRARERFKVKLAWLVVHAAARIVERNGNFKTYYQNEKGGLEGLEWKEFLQDKKKLRIRVFPVSDLAKQPAARFAQLTQLLNVQGITVEQFKRLFGLPDLDAENELDTADTDVIDMMLDTMIVKNRYVSPDTVDDLKLAKARTRKMVNLCRVKEVPEERINHLLKFLEDIESLEEQAAAAQAAKVPPPGPAGMTPPEGPLPGMPGPMGPPPGAPPLPPGQPPPPPPAMAA